MVNILFASDVDKPRRKSKRRGEPDEAAFWLVTPPDLWIEVGACLAFPRPEHAVNSKSFTFDSSSLHAPTSTQHSHSYSTAKELSAFFKAIQSPQCLPITTL